MISLHNLTVEAAADLRCVMYKTIVVINIIIYMYLQHSNVL